MLVALTARTLKPGTFDDFHRTFMGFVEKGPMPRGFRRFYMVRNSENPDEVISFGFFDCTPEELRADAETMGYAEQQDAIAPFLESVGADGLFEVVELMTP